ncbi:MAG: heavy metal translocating P-type ATPase [Capsulimonadaceae bacterium]
MPTEQSTFLVNGNSSGIRPAEETSSSNGRVLPAANSSGCHAGCPERAGLTAVSSSPQPGANGIASNSSTPSPLAGRAGEGSNSYAIVSAIPGRLRLRIAGSRRRILQEAAVRLSHLEQVSSERVVAEAASIIIEFDRSFPVKEMTLRVGAVIEGVIREDRAQRAEGVHPDAPLTLKRSPIAPVLGILHSIPGRLRLHIPHLRRRPHVAAHIETVLRSEHGITRFAAEASNQSVVIHYNPKLHKPARLLGLLNDMITAAVQSPPGHQEITRAKDIPTEEPAGLNPLALPTIAIAVSLVGVAPIALSIGLTALASLPVGARALRGIRERRACVDQLDIAAITVLGWLGEFFTAGLMTWLIGLGDLIRARTMRQSRRAISELMSPAGQTAWLQRDGILVSVGVDKLAPGDVVLVHPGDLVPVDGTVVEGRGLVDCKVLTGESVPVYRETGDLVYALTTVVDGKMAIRVEHIGRETRAGQVATMVEEAPLADTRVQNYAALLGDRLVIPLFGLAALTYMATGDALRFASIVILDFATGIRVSAPTTILSSMIAASRKGLFIKGGKAMEKLAVVDAIVFDKTGTLTRGEPSVTDVIALDRAYSSKDVLRLAACAEAKLKHPAATAIVRAARDHGIAVSQPDEMEYVLGYGVRAVVDGMSVQVGSRRFMDQLGIDLHAAAQFVHDRTAAANSLVYIGSGGELIGMLAYADPPRDESAAVILALRERGVKRIVMLTGDSSATARAVAEKLAITDIIADAYPDQKADVVEKLRRDGYSVAVIGDGVNDSPAFTRADVGISLAGGADVAKETADVILLDNSLWGIPKAIDMSRTAMRILRQNINIVVAPTAIGIGGSLAGLASPLIAAIINNGTTVIAALNALRPLFDNETRSLSNSGAFRIMEPRRSTTVRKRPQPAKRAMRAG